MNFESDPAWQRFYSYGFEYGTNEVRRRMHGILPHVDPRVELRRYRAQIRRALGLTDTAREAIRAINEGIAHGLAGREPRC